MVRTVGRPSSYDEVKAEELLMRLAEGETLTAICRSMGMRPRTVYSWTESHPDFAERFKAAREFGDCVIEDEAIDLADERNPDEIIDESETGMRKRTADNVARSRLRVETRLKVVARRKGAKISNEIKISQKEAAEIQVKTLTNEQLLEIARMTPDDDESVATA